MIEEKKGTFEVGVWVKNPERPVQKRGSAVVTANRFQALQEEEEMDAGFTRQG